jgi:hypothetical protein
MRQDELERFVREEHAIVLAERDKAKLERDKFRNDNERQTLIIDGLEWGLESFMA